MIKKLRQKSGLTQAELAEMMGYKSPQFISNLERGLCELPVKQFKKFARLVKCPVEVLIEHKLKVTKARLDKAFKR